MSLALGPRQYDRKVDSRSEIASIWIRWRTNQNPSTSRRTAFPLAILLLFLMCATAAAATYHVSPKGRNLSGSGSADSPWKTVGYGLRRIRGGDTLVLGSGTYASPDDAISTPPRGAPGRETVICAERDGTVVITSPQGLSLTHDVSHVRIEGLKFDAPHSKRILGNHVRILRTAFKGGPAEENTVQVGIGSKDHNDTRCILLEDCWVYGPGGRYNILIYNSRQVVLRRLVIRHDGGWKDKKWDPEAATCAYNSSQVSYQNVIVVDSNRPDYHNWYGSFYSTADSREREISWRGCIALNNRGTGLGVDPKYSGAIDNLLIWNVISFANDWGITLGSSGTVNGLIDRVTVGKTSPQGEGIAKWGNQGSVRVRKGLVFDVGVSSFRGVEILPENGGFSNRRKASIFYLPQGASKTGRWQAGQPEGDGIGAEIMNRIGATGAYYEDQEWDTVTSDPLWPWPFEDRIKGDFSEVDSRGFAAQGKGLYGGEISLTSYVWEFLGHPCPPGICSLSPNIIAK